MKRLSAMTTIIALVAAVLAASGLAWPAVTFAAPPADATALRAALKKTAAAASYRTDVELSITGNDPVTLAPNTELVAMRSTGENQRPNFHTTLTGFAESWLGADEEMPIEIIVANGTAYMRGPLPALGLDDERWYSMGGAASFPITDDSANLGALERANLTGLEQNGTESLDGRRCERYRSTDKRAALRAFDWFGGSSSSQLDTTRVLNAEVQFWSCDDGYVHQLRIAFDFDCSCKDPQKRVAYTTAPTTPMMKVLMTARYFDFDKRFNITAPADAVSMDQVMSGGGSFGSGGLTATVFNGGNIRQEPSLRGAVRGQLHAGQTVLLLEKTANGAWYHVEAPEANGWVSVTLLTIDPQTKSQVPIQGQGRTTAPPSTSGLNATVFNGGNVRATPARTGKVLDQINARETVPLLKRSKDGVWYQITTPRGITGWVHRSLLTIAPSVASQVPIAP